MGQLLFTAPDPLLPLIAEMTVISDITADITPDRNAEYDALAARARALSKQIEATRAGGLTGVIWKMRQTLMCLEEEAEGSDYEKNMLRSAIVDLENMVACSVGQAT